MYSLLLIVASLAALSQQADISCEAPISTGTLWYGIAPYDSYIGQIGVLEAFGNAELLAKYPGTDVVAHTVNVIPCNSTALNATIPPAGSCMDIPVILQLADDTTNCLALEAGAEQDVFITKQSCFYTDVSSQFVQFWTNVNEYDTLLPVWASTPAERWDIQFNEGDENEVLADPPVCMEGATCQDDQHYSFMIQE